ncbi:MAG: DUF5701 family protein [Nostocoides sp.]
MPVPSAAPLPSLVEQAERLVTLGVADLAGIDPRQVRAAVATSASGDGLLAIRPSLLDIARVAPFLRHRERHGFVVEDLTDLGEFGPTAAADVPDSDVYVVAALDRGDEFANWSPDEADPVIASRERLGLTVQEGVLWLLQSPGVLERGRCFMTTGSRLRRPDGRLDARTPALWISNGTGRDGRDRRHAPKVGWCWAGNRHTWLGIASAGAKTPLT